MKIFYRSSVLLFAFFTVMFSGCAYIPHDVVIKPEISVEQSNIGQNKTMLVTVKDGRLKDTIGFRTYLNTGRITVSAAQNLTQDIKSTIEKGFNDLGFSIIQQGSADRNTHVDIRLIDFESTHGFLTLGTFVRASFELECTLPSGKSFTNIYRVEYEFRHSFVSTAAKNRTLINRAISDALMRIFKDNDFLRFLETGQ
jgi:uncharacterized lipoprotein YajG